MKVSNEEVLRLVEQGMQQKDIAAQLGVSPAAISQRLKRLNVAVSKDVALRSARKIVDNRTDLSAILDDLRQRTQDLLGMIELAMETTDDGYEARKRLRLLIGPKGSPAALLVGLQGELRKQLEFYHAQARDLYSIRQVADFQEAVMAEIQGASPEVARAIVARLVKRGAIMSATDIGLRMQA